MKKIDRWGMTACILAAAVILNGMYLPPEDAAAHAAGRSAPDMKQPPTESADDWKTATRSVAARKRMAPDLWGSWKGKTDFPGDGSEERPYQIGSLVHLMGLSQAVAEGESFAGEYFELTQDINLGNLQENDGSWNPIGWYQNADEMEGEVRHPFSGHFDGQGHTIWNLNIRQSDPSADYTGLFGVIDGGSVMNLKVQAGDISGTDHAAVLAGELRGGAVVRDVTVSGYVSADNGEEGCAGGITAVADGSGGRVTIENCTARNIAVTTDQTEGCAGGIVGMAKSADLVDSVVETGNINSNHIQGLGYIGGIAGCMEDARIYNSYVDGLIGGHRSRAVGGIIGKYVSGDLILMRFAGEVASTGMDVASREGTFVGTRDPSHPFRYGTAPGDNFAYLFADTASKAKQAIGSGLAGDNTFSYSAHVGYWMDNQRSVFLLSGNSEKNTGEYFYQELEKGVQFIITEKLQNEFLFQSGAEGTAFRLDHFAPGQQGQPVKGYLLSVPRIDARNAGGTYDTDVAVFTAMPEGNLSYYRPIDKNHPAAVQAGVTVSVTTSPNNRNGNRYQMAPDRTERGGVKPPVYINNLGRQVPMTYVNGGTYAFTMPARDTQVNVEYVKVTTELSVTPEQIEITVTHTRTGDRKSPDTVTEVHDGNGTLIARYIEDTPDRSVQAQPIRIHGEHNALGGAADRTLLWSVDDNDLLSLISESGYTEKDARIMLNPGSAFIRQTLTEQVKKQADGGYLEAIRPAFYEKHAVVTASSNPETSADQIAVYGNCKVTVRFRILDYTTRRVEGLQMNKSDIVLTVTRRLTGECTEPAESVTCSEPVVLSAYLYPEQPFYKNVSWSDRGGGAAVVLTPQGVNASQCVVEARYDMEGVSNPAWIQNVINADKRKKKGDPYTKVDGRAEYTETVTAVSEDQTHGLVSAKCRVTIRFETIDETGDESKGESMGSGDGMGGFDGGNGHITDAFGGSGHSAGGSSGGGHGSGGTGGRYPLLNASDGGGLRAGASGSTGDSPAAASENALTGVWQQAEDGRWFFTSQGQTFAGRWAYLFNSFADMAKGQSSVDWFYFNADGSMATGWQWIAGADGMERCYYFNEQPDGTLGAMLHGVMTPDGWQVDENGAWTDGGVVQMKQPG